MADVKVIRDPAPSNIKEIHDTGWFSPEETVTQCIHIVNSFYSILPLTKLTPEKNNKLLQFHY